jgi:hypothetical protein
MVPRLVRLVRTASLGEDGDQEDESVALAATSILEAVETFIGPEFWASSTVEDQLGLPVRFGGFGGLHLPCACGGEGRVARLSSVTLT